MRKLSKKCHLMTTLSPDCRELRNLEGKAADIQRESLELLDSAHLQCEKKIEMTENRAEKLCQGSVQTSSTPHSIWQQLLVR